MNIARKSPKMNNRPNTMTAKEHMYNILLFSFLASLKTQIPYNKNPNIAIVNINEYSVNKSLITIFYSSSNNNKNYKKRAQDIML